MLAVVKNMNTSIFILVRLKLRDYVQLLGNHQISTITFKVTSILSYKATSGSLQVFFLTKPLLAHQVFFLSKVSPGSL